ncbi:MAG: hypothetical protein ACLFR1_16380, partial [Spirochaetia bacterium]
MPRKSRRTIFNIPPLFYRMPRYLNKNRRILRTLLLNTFGTSKFCPVFLYISESTGYRYLDCCCPASGVLLPEHRFLDVFEHTLEKRKHGKAGNRLTSATMPPGIIEGGETILLFSLFFILPGRIVLIFTIMAVLRLILAAHRVIIAMKHLS